MLFRSSLLGGMVATAAECGAVAQFAGADGLSQRMDTGEAVVHVAAGGESSISFVIVYNWDIIWFDGTVGSERIRTFKKNGYFCYACVGGMGGENITVVETRGGTNLVE